MNAEIIAVGTELLLGYTINDDAAHVSRALAGLGIPCYRHITVGDNPARLAEAIRASLQRADLVVTCGGLGPTVDDITLKTIAAVTGRRLVQRPAILRKIQTQFRKLGIKMPPSNRRQALLPKGAVELPNRIGTAPGFLLKIKLQRGQAPFDSFQQPKGPGPTKFLVALPGPPAELVPMLENHLIPLLRRRVGTGTIQSRTLKILGLTESEVDAKVRDLLALSGAASVGIYAHEAQVDLRITARASNPPGANRLIRRLERKIRGRLGRWIYGADDEKLESVVGDLLRRRRKRIAVAESCTGGLIQHQLTDVPGSSDYFVGGVVSYANTFKSDVLSVPTTILKKYGAVSPQVVQAMAAGVRQLTGADLGLAVTGIAGLALGARSETWHPKKSVGLAYIALSSGRKTRVHRFLFSGSRSVVKFKASQAALEMVRQHLSSSPSMSSPTRSGIPLFRGTLESLPSTGSRGRLQRGSDSRPRSSRGQAFRGNDTRECGSSSRST